MKVHEVGRNTSNNFQINEIRDLSLVNLSCSLMRLSQRILCNIPYVQCGYIFSVAVLTKINASTLSCHIGGVTSGANLGGGGGYNGQSPPHNHAHACCYNY